jgi:hypothetical protein
MLENIEIMSHMAFVNYGSPATNPRSGMLEVTSAVPFSRNPSSLRTTASYS